MGRALSTQRVVSSSFSRLTVKRIEISCRVQQVAERSYQLVPCQTGQAKQTNSSPRYCSSSSSFATRVSVVTAYRHLHCHSFCCYPFCFVAAPFICRCPFRLSPPLSFVAPAFVYRYCFSSSRPLSFVATVLFDLHYIPYCHRFVLYVATASLLHCFHLLASLYCSLAR